MAKDMRGLEVGQRERLTTTQTDILTGRILETVDFNNPVSNDRAVSHGGDAVSSDDSAKSEKIFIDTRRFANRVQAVAPGAERVIHVRFNVALTASQFTGTFGDVKLETLDVTIKHLVFVESSQPADSVKIPWNERTSATRLFGSVPMICAALSSTALPLLKPQFMKARDGLAVRAFVDILFKQLLGVEPRLRDALCDAREASSVVSLLHELFRQIDINGDQLVDWEEFTNHTISSGMMAGLYGADEFTVSYELDLGYSPTSSGGPSAHGSVQLMRYVPELGRILVVSKDSPKFKAYDALGGFQHEYSFDAGGENGGPASPTARGGGADAEAPSEGSVLISGGFDNEAIVWDITSHEILCTMSGHQHAIGTVEIIAPRVECIDCFKLPFTDPSGPTRSVVMPWNRKHVVDDFPDLFFGGSRVYHMVPVKTMREFAPPSSSIYNSTSYQFVSAVGNTVHVWDSRTGRYLERFRVDKREISSMCFDMPRMRRVFLGTESGAIATLNYVTGEVLAVCAAHDREVSGLVFCELTKCVISYGADRRLHVLKDVKSSLSVLRTAENARKGATLTCLAYSAPLSLIATGDSEGGLVLWDFQTLQQHALIRLEGPAAACAVLDPYPLLATGDTDGVVRLWQLGLDAGYVTVDPLCVMGPPEDGTIGNPAAADRRPGSPARESNSTPSITGLAFLHKHRLHDGAAIEGSFKGDRARRATLRHLSADAAKSASTSRRYELDKYDGEVLVASTDAGTLACWHFDFVHAEFPHRTLPVLEAERAARAKLSAGPPRLGTASCVDVDRRSDAPFDVSAEARPATGSSGCGTRGRSVRALGEFELPNRLEDDAKRTIPEKKDWDYFLKEAPAVTADDERVARELLRRATAPKKVSLRTRFQRAVKRVMTLGAFGGVVEIEDGHEKTEEEILEEWERLRESASGTGRRDAKSVPLQRVEKFAASAEKHGTNAFSDKSINGGLKAGLFDVEGYQQLKGIARFPERRTAYARRVDGGPSEDLPVADDEPHLKRSQSLITLKKTSKLNARRELAEDVVPLVDASALPRRRDDDGSASSDDESRSSAAHLSRSTSRHMERMAAAMQTADGPEGGGRRARRGGARRSTAAAAAAPSPARRPSGMINMEEWFLFLGRMNQKLSPIESQLLFLHIDKDRDGEIQGSKESEIPNFKADLGREITMRELLAIVFQKATAKQLNTMHRHLWDLHLRDATERKQRDIEKLVKKKQKEMFTDVPGHDAADAGA
ncbi:WD repeat-containing protein [Aureococcus anophagefferens]|nr:WD repeat-containing protein [Aureococcus anophagefferens]